MQHAAYTFFLLVFLSYGFPWLAMAQERIEGRVLDKATQSPLAYASIGIAGKRYGTVSNESGSFTFRLPPEVSPSDTLICSFIGYATFRIPLQDLPKNPLTISLDAIDLILDEVVIRPRKPEDYIRSAVAKIPQNYLPQTHQTTGYYSDYLRENQTYLQSNELLFVMNTPAYGDTTHPAVRVLQGRVREDLGELQFWKEKRAKQEQKKGEKSSNIRVENIFDGPADAVTFDPLRNLEPFLQEENFGSYRYTLEDAVAYQGKTLMVIRFRPRGKVEHQKLSGRIFIDLQTEAFVSIEYEGELIVPTALRPILLLMGIGVSNPKVSKIARFRPLTEGWTLDNVLIQGRADLTDKKMFKKNEHFTYTLEQVFVVTDIATENIAPIPDHQRLDPKKPLSEQLPPYDAAFWERYNLIRPRAIK
ncbi:MAG: carboxypeptidase-like regulatory domain-containing protein [Bernardetiaceae bacterium]